MTPEEEARYAQDLAQIQKRQQQVESFAPPSGGQPTQFSELTPDEQKQISAMRARLAQLAPDTRFMPPAPQPAAPGVQARPVQPAAPPLGFRPPPSVQQPLPDDTVLIDAMRGAPDVQQKQRLKAKSNK